MAMRTDPMEWENKSAKATWDRYWAALAPSDGALYEVRKSSNTNRPNNREPWYLWRNGEFMGSYISSPEAKKAAETWESSKAVLDSLRDLA